MPWPSQALFSLSSDLTAKNAEKSTYIFKCRGDNGLLSFLGLGSAWRLFQQVGTVANA